MATRYSEEEIEAGLIALATYGTAKASEITGIPQSTLSQWKTTRAERYYEVATQEAPKWRAQAAASFAEVVDELTGIERAAIDKLKREIDRVETKDLPNVLKAASVSKGINTTHVNNMHGLPSEIVEHRWDLPTIERAIRASERVIEGTAEEIPLELDAPED